MRRVLIAGRNSFIGTAVERRLGEFADQYRCETLEMRAESWRTFDFSGFDCVVHVAGIAHVSPRPAMRPLYEAVNRDLAIECARRAKAAGVGQFVFLSSANVFGEAAPAGRDREIAPDAPPAPANAYGKSKLEAEQGIRALEDDTFRAAILRPMMVFGPGCKGNYNQLSRFARRFAFFPDLPNRRGAVYVEDLAELIRRLIDRGAGGTHHPQTMVVSTADFARAIARARGARLRLTRAFNPLLRLCGRRGLARRAFGGFCYRADLAERGWDGEGLSFAACVKRTEDANG